jgi:hypothetical protein
MDPHNGTRDPLTQNPIHRPGARARFTSLSDGLAVLRLAWCGPPWPLEFGRPVVVDQSSASFTASLAFSPACFTFAEA